MEASSLSHITPAPQYSLDMTVCTSKRHCGNSSEYEKLMGNEPMPLGQSPYRLNHYSTFLSILAKMKLVSGNMNFVTSNIFILAEIV
jgi:hypothetical protein